LLRVDETSTARAAGEWTQRQKDVLDAALHLMVEEGDALTMAAVAQRASCSKETLYKWFGDRDGLLTAAVRRQAAKVRVAPLDGSRLDLAALIERLEQFARDWLTVISSETSIALNRIAVGQAASDKTALGAIVLQNGRLEMGRRLKPVLEAGRSAGLIGFANAEDAFRTFFGLIARDVQIRLLLGEALSLTAPLIAADATRATAQFIALYRANPEPAPAGHRP